MTERRPRKGPAFFIVMGETVAMRKQTGLFVAFCSGAVTLLGGAVWAEAPILEWPVDCTLGQTCYIEDYVDRDPNEGTQKDFACGFNARDDHKGTDIALLSFEAMEAGVEVRAAAAGTVRATRDGMADDRLMRGVTDQNACGNAVVITHNDGWETIYCHLKRGSLTVKSGDTVEAGQSLGQIGLSGQTNHPHLHIGLRENGVVRDPFDPDDEVTCGVMPDNGLWADALPYYRTTVVTAGFSTFVPTLAQVQSGEARDERRGDDKPLVLYGHFFYAQDGDVLEMRAVGPKGGTVFSTEITLEAPQNNIFRAYGRKAPEGGWPGGDFWGEITLMRDGVIIGHRFAHATVE